MRQKKSRKLLSTKMGNTLFMLSDGELYQAVAEHC